MLFFVESSYIDGGNLTGEDDTGKGDEVLEIMTGKGEAIGDRDKRIKNVGMDTEIPEEKMETNLFLISKFILLILISWSYYLQIFFTEFTKQYVFLFGFIYIYIMNFYYIFLCFKISYDDIVYNFIKLFRYVK